MTAFGDEVRRLLADRGMSARELARRAYCDNGHLSKVLRGLKRATPALAAQLDKVLGDDGTLLALAEDTGPFTRDIPAAQRDRLAWAAKHPRRADQAAAESLAEVLAAQRKAEDTLGSAAVLAPVKAQMAVVGQLAREAPGAVRPRLLDVAGQWAQFNGWLALNVGDLAQSHDRFSLALEWASEIDDRTMIATVLSFRGYAAWRAGDAGPVCGLAQAAQRPGVALSQRAYGAALEARGHALARAAAAAERKAGEAVELAELLTQRPDENRPWSYWYTPAWFACQRGIVLGHFAHIPRYHDLAMAALRDGYAGLSPAEQHSEWGAGYLVHLAAVHARGGDVRESCAVALRAAATARQMGSAPLAGTLKRLRAALSARWPHDAAVAELADALR